MNGEILKNCKSLVLLIFLLINSFKNEAEQKTKIFS